MFSCHAGKDLYELNRNGSRLILSSNGQILSNTSTTSALRSHIRNHSISLLVQNNDNTDNMYQITDYKNTSSQPATIVHSYLADRHERKSQTISCNQIVRSLYRTDLSDIPRNDYTEFWDFYKDPDNNEQK
jgi:hypothetical protein